MNIPTLNPATKALIFDLDGTLADTMPLHFKAWQQASRANNFELSHKLFLECAGLPTNKIVAIINKKYGLNLDPEVFSDQKEYFFTKEMAQIKDIPAIMELVYQNHGKLPMSVGTGGRKHIALKTMELLGLDKYISILVSMEDVNNHKPAPDTFLRCAELMGIEAKYCQVFEDGVRGIEAALNAGMMVTDVRPFYLK